MTSRYGFRERTVSPIVLSPRYPATDQRRDVQFSYWTAQTHFLHFSYPMRYNHFVLEVRQTSTYAEWFSKLRDRTAKARIDIRIRRLSLGNPGEVKPVGEGVSELRVDYGHGYRVYFIKRADLYVVLLAGGEKSSQAGDITKARALAREL